MAAALGAMQKLTAAAHEGSIRDIRFTPGSLGFALGDDPDLANLTCSITSLDPGGFLGFWLQV
jgi:hypothetical protein